MKGAKKVSTKIVWDDVLPATVIQLVSHWKSLKTFHFVPNNPLICCLFEKGPSLRNAVEMVNVSVDPEFLVKNVTVVLIITMIFRPRVAREYFKSFSLPIHLTSLSFFN